MHITHHTELLNALIAKYNLKSYLEIGVNNSAMNFDKIRCDIKTGVDPEIDNVFKMKSDEFFKLVEGQGRELTKINRRGYTMPDKWDLIFIDGLHHADQVKRDFENSLKCLSDNGFIVIHDCLPTEEITTCVPRGEQRIWHGDVYKFCMLLNGYPNIQFKTFNIDNGCCLVWKDAAKKSGAIPAQIDWEGYQRNGRQALNVTDEVLI